MFELASFPGSPRKKEGEPGNEASLNISYCKRQKLYSVQRPGSEAICLNLQWTICTSESSRRELMAYSLMYMHG